MTFPAAQTCSFSLTLFHALILNQLQLTLIFRNVGTIIAFRVGSEDAKFIEKEFEPVFTATDLVSLPQYSMYIKLLIDGTTSKPFSAISLSLANHPAGLSSNVMCIPEKDMALLHRR